MRNNRELLRSIRYEVIPTATIEAKVVESVPKDVTVTVTASPNKGLAPTLDLAERLAGHGYRVVPHLSARLVVDDVHLKEIVARLVHAGVDDVFVPGRRRRPARRPLPQRPRRARRADRARTARSGTSASPATPRATPRSTTTSSCRPCGTSVPTPPTSSATCASTRKVIDAWARRVRRRGVTLPIQLGLAGPVERTKLLAMAGKIGVGESTRFLAQALAVVRAAGGRLLAGAPAREAPRRERRRAARLHVQPGRRDRAVAAAACSTHEQRQLPLQARVADRHDLQRQAQRGGGRRSPAPATTASPAAPATPRGGSGRSSRPAATGTGPGPARRRPCGGTTAPGSRSARRCPARPRTTPVMRATPAKTS